MVDLMLYYSVWLFLSVSNEAYADDYRIRDGDGSLSIASRQFKSDYIFLFIYFIYLFLHVSFTCFLRKRFLEKKEGKNGFF